MFFWDPKMSLTWHHTSSLLGSQFSLKVSASPPLPCCQSRAPLLQCQCWHLLSGNLSVLLYLGVAHLILVHGLFLLLNAYQISKVYFSCGIQSCFIKKNSFTISEFLRLIQDTQHYPTSYNIITCLGFYGQFPYQDASFLRAGTSIHCCIASDRNTVLSS